MNNILLGIITIPPPGVESALAFINSNIINIRLIFYINFNFLSILYYFK